MNNNDEKIVICIASYVEKELLNTVKSALIQADNPDRIFFSICYQSDDLKDYYELKKIKNCKIKHLTTSESKGTCYARKICTEMIEDEKYVYQIDAHMRFVKHYDSKLIEQLLSLNDPKASISFYPDDCTEEMMKLPLDHKVFNKPNRGCIIKIKEFLDDSFPFLHISSEIVEKNDERFRKNPFISAGNYFSFCNIYKKILHDPEMYYYGDELPMAIRYFTHGVNNYLGKEGYIYHEYVDENRGLPNVENGFLNEQIRFSQLLNLNQSNNAKYELGEFGLGTERSLEDFEEFTGIDFKNRKIYMSAELGEFEDESLKDKMSYLKCKNQSMYQKQLQKRKIEIIVIDLFGEYQDCINSCIKNAENKENVSFIVGTVSNNEPTKRKKQIKKIIHYKKEESYAKILADSTNYLGESYAVVVDSSFRFMWGWDTYLCDTISSCGKNTILTSWIWLADNTEETNELKPYVNVIKEFNEFDNYLPSVYYNYEIDLDNKRNPYQTPFVSDGFLFGDSKVLKEIKVDPNLTYDEHIMMYSLRLWTNGIDIYYPNISYIYKTKSEELLKKGESHYSIICALQGIDNEYSQHLEGGYEYDVGDKRTVWSWYDFMKFDYSNDSNFNE